MKNILFVIQSNKLFNTGLGGHYYSLLTYANILKYKFNVTILHYSNIGYSLLDEQKIDNVTYIKKKYKIKYCEYYNYADIVIFFSVILKISKLKKQLLKDKKYVISVKPGGVNPKFYYPFFNEIFCFSSENIQWFHKNYLYKNITKLTLLPNRIERIEKNINRLEEFGFIKPQHINILRISRINTNYIESFHKTIKLHDLLEEKGFMVNTVLVGNIKNQVEYKILLKKVENNSNITILTNTKYTNFARELIPAFDIIIGIGRGFMEAVSEKKVVLGLSKSYDFPIIVDQVNYEYFKRYNFSMRNDYFKEKNESELIKILNIIKDLHYRETIQSFLHEKFEVDYNANKILLKFHDIINKKHDSTPRIILFLDYFLSLIFEMIIIPYSILIVHIINVKKNISKYLFKYSR